jgi:uncharacterized protein (UPF0179 family)
MCSCIQKDTMIILLETNDKCKNDQCPTYQKCKTSNLNYKKEAELAEISKKNGLKKGDR